MSPTHYDVVDDDGLAYYKNLPAKEAERTLYGLLARGDGEGAWLGDVIPDREYVEGFENETT